MATAQAQSRHERVSSWIRDQIETGGFGENDRLPSESQLGAQFSVSRITIRRALQTLESEGIIYRRQGLGSFVASSGAAGRRNRLSGFFEQMEAAGVLPTSEILHEQSEEADARVASALGVHEGATVFRIDRLQRGNGQEVVFDRIWLPLIYAHLLEKHDLSETSIYAIMENAYNISVCSGRFRLEAVNAPNDVAQHLDVPWGRALLLIEHSSSTETGQQICFQQRFCRSDRIAYESNLIWENAALVRRLRPQEVSGRFLETLQARPGKELNRYPRTFSYHRLALWEVNDTVCPDY